VSESWEHTRLDHRSRQAASIATAALSLLTQHGAPALTMAAIADKADVSRQTLYRYFKDIDAVLVGIAELVTSHDEAFAQLVRQQSDPRSQLELITSTATDDVPGHDHPKTAALLAVLPPAGRDIVAQHQAQANNVLREVLQRGRDDGTFSADIDPGADAPLILGLLAAADPSNLERAITIVHQLVESH